MNLINQSGSLLIRLSGGRRRDEKERKENEEAIIAATLENLRRVTTPDTNKNAEERARWIDELFDKEAILRSTVGQVVRTKTSTPDIINYFATYWSRSIIPTLAIKNTKFDVRRLGQNIYVNLAYVQFTSNEGGNPKEITAEMTYIFRKDESDPKKWNILLVHSAPIYKRVPDELRQGGDFFKSWDTFKLWDLASDTSKLTDEDEYIHPYPNRGNSY